MRISSRLQGRRAVITGAARGIGLACAERFLAEGCNVLIADIDHHDGLSPKLASFGDACRFVSCDVARRGDLEAAIALCVKTWGGIDILLNNAGIAPTGDILALEEHVFDRVIAINLKAAFVGTQLAAHHMVTQGRGVILNMSSVNAILNIPALLAYNVAKGGLNQLTRNTAIALAPHGIRVCGIGPGTILTELTRDAVWTDDSARHAIMARTPMKRPGEPAEIAAIAAFLASDDASYITGETIYADGGRLGLNYTVAVD